MHPAIAVHYAHMYCADFFYSSTTRMDPPSQSRCNRKSSGGPRQSLAEVSVYEYAHMPSDAVRGKGMSHLPCSCCSGFRAAAHDALLLRDCRGFVPRQRCCIPLPTALLCPLPLFCLSRCSLCNRWNCGRVLNNISQVLCLGELKFPHSSAYLPKCMKPLKVGQVLEYCYQDM